MGSESRTKPSALEKEGDEVATADLLQLLDDAENNPDIDGYELRMQLASMVLLGLREKDWTQGQLAEAADMDAPKITKIVHGDSNVTFRTAWRVLKALGKKPRLTDEPEVRYQITSSGQAPHHVYKVTTDGPDIISAQISGTPFRIQAGVGTAQTPAGHFADSAQNPQH